MRIKSVKWKVKYTVLYINSWDTLDSKLPTKKGQCYKYFTQTIRPITLSLQGYNIIDNKNNDMANKKKQRKQGKKNIKIMFQPPQTQKDAHIKSKIYSICHCISFQLEY